MLENLKNYLGTFLSITMNITALSHAKRYLNFLQIGNLAKAVVQVVLVADALFIAMLRTVKSILCSQDGVLLKLGFTKLELINKINFKINGFFRLGGKIKKKTEKNYTLFPGCFNSLFNSLCLERHSQGGVQLSQHRTSSFQPKVCCTEV